VIRFLTNFEKNYTQTNHQTSLAIKSILAQLVNSILIPIIANYFIKNQNIYSPNGLADDIFIFSITNSLVAPILKIIDGGYFFSRIMAQYKNRPSNYLLYIRSKTLS
jgi:hypothetical protein